MKNGLAVFLLALFGQVAFAEDTVKIGFVDIQRAISQSQAGKSAREAFQAQVKKMEAELLKEKQEVERLKNDFDKKGPLLKEEDKRNMEREIQRRERNYLLSGREANEELRQKENEMTADILKEILKIVAEIGKSEKFTLILERSQVPYLDQAMDITGRVVELYNSRTEGKATKAK